MSFDKLGWLNFRAFFLTFIGEIVKMIDCSCRDLPTQREGQGPTTTLRQRASVHSFSQQSGLETAQNLLEPCPERSRKANNAELRCKKEELRHILLGSPEAIRQTIHQLHVLNYVESVLWSPIAAVRDRLIITPEQGEYMSLVRQSR